MTLRERIWAKVSIDESTGCWNWIGAKSKTGNVYYGFIGVARKNALAHRTMYQLERGEIPQGMTLDHLCRNTLCVNPEHLEPVPMRENTLRGTSPVARNAQKTHCDHGHEFSEENTSWVQDKYGRVRHCKECVRRNSREYQRRKAQEPRPVEVVVPSHCKHGHAMTEDNLLWRGSKVACKECMRDRVKRWQQRNPDWWRKYKKPSSVQ